MRQFIKEINGLAKEIIVDGKPVKQINDNPVPMTIKFIVDHKEAPVISRKPVSGTMKLLGTEHRFKVKKWMTQPSTPEFDFHDKFNEKKPMPCVVMQGKILKETEKMYKVELTGTTDDSIVCCVVCGKTLTNAGSKAARMGPVCLGKLGLQAGADATAIDNALQDLFWSGWIPKSAIVEMEELK